MHCDLRYIDLGQKTRQTSVRPEVVIGAEPLAVDRAVQHEGGGDLVAAERGQEGQGRSSNTYFASTLKSSTSRGRPTKSIGHIA
jgi:hypothetical protein